MRNFDEGRHARRRTEEERTFVLHGETFVLRAAVRPEVLNAFDLISDASGVTETMKALDEMFVDLIDDRDGAADRYATIRADDTDPITLEDLDDVVKWMIEVVTGRPTSSPSGSTDGREATGTTSTVDSSSQALQAA
jgi:hypothetical protein